MPCIQVQGGWRPKTASAADSVATLPPTAQATPTCLTTVRRIAPYPLCIECLSLMLICLVCDMIVKATSRGRLSDCGRSVRTSEVQLEYPHQHPLSYIAQEAMPQVFDQVHDSGRAGGRGPAQSSLSMVLPMSGSHGSSAMGDSSSQPYPGPGESTSVLGLWSAMQRRKTHFARTFEGLATPT